MKLTRIIFCLLVFCTFIILNSCNNFIPTAFWKNYKSNYIIENISDQGPYGGHAAMYWKTKTKKTFTSDTIIAFAVKNGWTLTGIEKFNLKNIKEWKENGKAIFPLTSNGFTPKLIEDNISEDFPRWINSDITIYKFKTNFVIIKPESDDSIEENGFVIINKEGNEMSIYNLWGE
ncbi:hypothetical protein [Flavobacterium marginilacus]|uniref:hypothetical protein n=1 Tax=Flavobacterium marginilacus TaxID=3003256 RepID=UPI00248F1900|nr:hypothetical protein [Flavobacterium marginilacus]